MCYESGWFSWRKASRKVAEEQPKVDAMKKPTPPNEAPAAPASSAKVREREKTPA